MKRISSLRLAALALGISLTGAVAEAAEFLGVEIEVAADRTVARVRTDQDVEYKASPAGLDGVAVELSQVRVEGSRQLPGGGLVQGVRVEAIGNPAEPATLVTFALRGQARPRFTILPDGVLELRFDNRPLAQSHVAQLVAGARQSVVRAPRYDAGYRQIAYPGGDPGWEVGCGVDVVVRAYRNGGVDLQQLIHADIVLDPTAYGIAEADSNIDHRRLRNLERFLKRRAERLPTDRSADWRPGDLVLWARNDSALADHVGVVSDRRAPSGRPLVIHHLPGEPPREVEDLFRWPVRAHLRWWPVD